MRTLLPRNVPHVAARGIAVALFAVGAAGNASAGSYSTLLDISNNQNWRDPAWGEVTIQDDDAMGADGIKFTVRGAAEVFRGSLVLVRRV